MAEAALGAKEKVASSSPGSVRGESQENDQEADPEEYADHALGSKQVVYRSHGKLVSVNSHEEVGTLGPLDSVPRAVTEEGSAGASTYNAAPVFPSDPRESRGGR